MSGRLGRALIVVGAALLVGALSLFAWGSWDDARARDAAAGVVEALEPLLGTVDAAEGWDMAAVIVDGQDYVGVLAIPALGLELPVASTWSYEQLADGPCRYFGSVAGGDLVIAGRSYDSHFGRIGSLGVGDEVSLTCADGTVCVYEVAEIDSVGADDIDAMTSGEFALTLFTDTGGGQSRVAVRCDRVA